MSPRRSRHSFSRLCQVTGETSSSPPTEQREGFPRKEKKTSVQGVSVRGDDLVQESRELTSKGKGGVNREAKGGGKSRKKRLICWSPETDFNDTKI